MDFTEVQNTFTNHIRDPKNNPAPTDIEDRRMGIYRDLLYRNIESFMANGFPVLRKITADDKWHAMIRDYFKSHQARTPLFPKMTQEFLYYLEHERAHNSEDYPFIFELAHYEWVEVSLSLDTREIETEGFDSSGDLLEGIPVLSELILALTYQYPVHKISPDFLPDKLPEQPTYLIVFRDHNDTIGFMDMNPVSARLLELLLQKSGKSGREILLEIAEEMQHPDPKVVIAGGLETMQTMQEKEIILGTRKN